MRKFMNNLKEGTVFGNNFASLMFSATMFFLPFVLLAIAIVLVMNYCGALPDYDYLRHWTW